MTAIQNSGEGPQAPAILDEDQDWDRQPHCTVLGIDLTALQQEAGRALMQFQAAQPVAEWHGSPAAMATPAGQPEQGAVGFPPGFAGEIARYIYQAAPRPVVEVAVVGALGLLAGICGREWNVSGSGLNIYAVLIARSGIGKEAMHAGIARLIAAARLQFPPAGEFVCFDDFASGPALTKHLINAPCSVNVAGEIGHKFCAMAKDNESAMRSLRRTMTNLYGKSGRGNIAGGIVYSSQENSVSSLDGVAYSLIGESTPGTFFESLTRGMMEDGFMSRFTVIEYTGDRNAKNKDRLDEPPAVAVNRLVALMTHAHTLRGRGLFMDVGYLPTAEALLDAFEAEADAHINSTDDESRRQMWNRAVLKALRIAALLAVGDNYMSPTINDDHAAWAIGLVRSDIAVFGKRIASGDVGDGSDDGREARLMEICREYLTMQPADVPNWAKTWEEARRVGLVAKSYLQKKTQRIAAFDKHPRGGKAALDTAIQMAIENGRMGAVKEGGASRQLSFTGKLYRILDVTSHRDG